MRLEVLGLDRDERAVFRASSTKISPDDSPQALKPTSEMRRFRSSHVIDLDQLAALHTNQQPLFQKSFQKKMPPRTKRMKK
jgi:hypothetical protein